MKLVSFLYQDREQAGILTEAGVRPLGATMNEVIDHPALLDRAQDEVPLASVTLLAPIPHPRQDIICLGLNYAEHAEEAYGYSSQAFSANRAHPVFFSKRATFCQGSGTPIPAHEALTQRLDYEAELAVVLGRDARDVPLGEAEAYIFGYTVINDVSARDLQTNHKQWYFGKSLDGFCPMGPCLVTRDEIAYPPALDISATVNGELRQHSNTRMLIHSIDEIIHTLTGGMLLKAGTIIATGTPKGVAMGMAQPAFLRRGDRVACAIEGIGTLENTVE